MASSACGAGSLAGVAITITRKGHSIIESVIIVPNDRFASVTIELSEICCSVAGRALIVVGAVIAVVEAWKTGLGRSISIEANRADIITEIIGSMIERGSS